MKSNPGSKKESGKPAKESFSNGKQKESRSQSCESQDKPLFNFPKLEIVDKSSLFTFNMYTVLKKNTDDVVGIEDLDQLQLELEQMLSATVVNLTTLQAELAGSSSSDGNKSDASASTNKKRKLNDTRAVKPSKEIKKEAVKAECSSSDNETDNSSEIFCGQKKEPKKKIINELSSKFWASVEPYVGEITNDNLKELEDLIQSCDNDMTIKIPPLGVHYTNKWADEDITEERQSSAGRQGKNSPASESDSVSLLKRASNMCSDRTPGPLVQRLVSALLEEPTDSYGSKLGDDNDSKLFLGKHPPYHTSLSFEKRIRRELEIVGLLDTNDNTEDSDEVLAEIKKCQEELKTVATVNKEHLSRLLGEAKHEMKKQEVKNKIKALDSELIEIHRKIAPLKLNMRLNKKILQKKEQDHAWKTLQSREALLKTLHEM